jgi:Uma2 family endonuclease
MAPSVKEWTVDDLAGMPDDGQRYEVIDGELFVTPAPALRHQGAILRLALLIAPYVDSHAIGQLVVAPADVTFSRRRSVQPDLFVAPLVNGKQPRHSSDIRALLLAVEVLSPSSVRADRVVKRSMYRDQGVPEYWVIDLDARAVERSTPLDSAVDVEKDSLTWHPVGAPAPLIIDLRRYFADVLDR